MKKIKLLFVLTIFLSVSCTKNFNDPVVTHPTLIGSKLLEKLNNLSSIEIQQKAYASLSNSERFEVWQAKIIDEVNSGFYNESQVNAIQEILKVLKLELFQDRDKLEVFQSITLPKWIESNKSLFSKENVNSIFVSFRKVQSSNKSYSLQTTGGEGGAIGHCHCALGSKFTCFSVSSFHNCARYDPCYIADRGCGVFGEFPCDGNICY